MLRLIELFAGIGSQTQALKNIGVPHEVTAVSEIDKYASRSYEALHGNVNNLGDITQIKELPAADLWTYSFPCQDISVAGKMAGIKDGTRSGLLYHVERLLIVAQQQGKLPKYLLLENVKNLVGKGFKADYEKWLAFLNSMGYQTYWKVLNAKNYGIPQNRERVFGVSILGDNKPFVFPQAIPLLLRLKDMLEDDVDEKFYLNNASIERIVYSNFAQEHKRIMDGDICSTLLARDYKDPKCVSVGNVSGDKWDKMHDVSRRVNDTEGLAPTIHTCPSGNTEPKIVAGQFQPVDRDYNQKGLQREEQFECRNDEISNAVLTGDKKNCVCIVAQRGRQNENGEWIQQLEVNDSGLSNTLTSVQKDNMVYLGYLPKSCQGNRVYDSDGISAAVTAKGGGKGGNGGGLYKEILVYDDYNGKLRQDSDTIGTLTTNIGVSAERNGYKVVEISDRILSGDAECSRTIRCGGHGSTDKHSWDVITIPQSEPQIVNSNVQSASQGAKIRVRKLTPRECLRLMGWKDGQIDRIQAAGISATQQYKQAGNGIVVDVLEAIFTQLFIGGD